MFELVADGTVENICARFAQTGKPYGFGGIARVGGGALPAEKIIGEHVRLGSSRVILSRSFCNTSLITEYEEIEKIFQAEVPKIRTAEQMFIEAEPEKRMENHLEVQQIVKEIVGN